MEWYGSQNIRSKEVADYIDLFSNKQELKRVHRPLKLMNSPRGFDKGSKFRHVSEQLIEKGFDEIKSDYNGKIDLEDDKLKYDIIFAELPINMQPNEEFVFDNKIKVGPEFNHLVKSFSKLNEKGRLFCLFPGVMLFGKKQKKILDTLKNRGFYYNSIIKCEGLWKGLTNIDLYLFCFERKQSKNLFVGYFNNTNFNNLFHNYSKTSGENIQNGKWVERNSFITIDNIIYEEQIESKGDYSGYPKKNIEEISKEIIPGRHQKELSNGKNTIFIPKVGNSNVVVDIEKTNLKAQNIFKVELDEKLVINEYAMFFLNTDTGINYRESLKTGAAIKFISKNNLQKLVIFLPDLTEQKELVKVSNNLESFLEKVKDLKKNLAYNPRSVMEVSKTIKKFTSKLADLTVEDKIIDIIKEGENKKVEFKETFSFNSHTNNKRDENLIKSSVKNIVAFLNTEGGVLLIGVKDNGEISGIKDEIEKSKSKDKFKLYFSDLVQQKIGSIYNSHVDYKIHNINGKEILIVNCKKSNEPCFYNKKEFYIRQNPKAQLLEGKEMISYTNDRFK